MKVKRLPLMGIQGSLIEVTLEKNDGAMVSCILSIWAYQLAGMLRVFDISFKTGLPMMALLQTHSSDFNIHGF